MKPPLLASFVFLATALPAPADPDAVTEWNAALSRCAAESLSHAPHLVARAFAITHRGMRDAIDAAQADRRHGACGDAHAAAASAAGLAIVRTILPMGEAEFGALHARQMGAIPAGAGKDFGVKVGGRVASSWLARREDDKWPRVYRAAAASALRPADPPAVCRPGTTRWQTVSPFVLRSARYFTVARPFWLVDNRFEPNERLRSRKTLDLPADVLSAIESEFWNRDPLLIWNGIARALTLQRPPDLRGNAQFFSVLNTALADGLLSASHWNVLYAEGYVVEAYIHAADDPRSMIPEELAAEYNVSPQMIRVGIPIPNYPDEAAVIAGAARAVIARQVGESTSFSVEADWPLDVHGTVSARHFASVALAAKEAVAARLLNRQCTCESGVAGFELGAEIGDYVAKRAGGK